MDKSNNKTNSISETWEAILTSDQLTGEDDAIQFYSIKKLKKRLSHLSSIYSPFQALHTVAIKTNPHPCILKKIAEWGYGLEAASLQEVILAARTGIDPKKIIFNSPVKTIRELKYVSTEFDGLTLNANCIAELDRIPMNHGLKIGLRINPISGGETTDLYDVSGENSKFGVPVTKTDKILKAVKKYNITQLHIHSGSKTKDLKKSIRGIEQVVDLAQLINQRLGLTINTINIGGGLSAGNSNKQSHIWMKQYANQLENIPKLNKDFRIVTEFGQWIHQHQGVAFSKVEYVEHFKKKSVAYVHLGGDMFVRQIYTENSRLNIQCIDNSGSLKSGKNRSYDLAGPLCFNGDYISKNIMLPELRVGDIVAIYPCGANTYGLWSRHCSRNIPALFTDQIESDAIKKVSKSWNPFLKTP